MDFAMPFMVQTFREFHTNLNKVTVKVEEAEKERLAKEEEAKANKEGSGGVADAGLVGLYSQPQMLALAPPTSYGLPMGGGYVGGYSAPMNGYGMGQVGAYGF